MSLNPSEHRAWSMFFVAHGLMVKRIDKAMAASGVVSLEIYDVLLHLEMAEEQRMRMSELADAVLLSRSGLTRLADRLEKDGLIERQACPGDRRAIHVALTAKGLAERVRAWPVFEKVIVSDFAANLEPGDADQVATIFGRLCEQLGFKWISVASTGCSGNHD